jgi:hypothetical protein
VTLFTEQETNKFKTSEIYMEPQKRKKYLMGKSLSVQNKRKKQEAIHNLTSKHTTINTK